MTFTPTPSLPVAQPTQFSYQFTDLNGNLIAVLPLTGVKFDLVLNDTGQWSATLPIEDAGVNSTAWINATAVNKTCLWIYAGTTLVYGGLVRSRKYTMSKQAVELSGSDFCCYLDQRLQAKDYSTTWTAGAGSAFMAAQMVTDALAVAGSLPISTALDGTEPSNYYISASFPLSQQQSLTSIIQQLQKMGYLVGFDYACDCYLIAGVPTGVITFSYPRRGRIAGSTGLTLDTGTARELAYNEDGTQQADQVQEMATATGGVGNTSTWEQAISVDGYPLLQAVFQHAVFSAQTFYTSSEVLASQAVLAAWGADDLALYAYPATSLTVKVPLFGRSLSLGEFIVGDDIRVLIQQTVGLPVNPRFPAGMDFYWRIVKAAVAVSDEGDSTMDLTLNLPPASTPQRPPV